MEYTEGELYLVSETEYDHIIYLRDKPNRRDKIVARFINKADALLFLATPDMYEALKLYQEHQEGTSGHYCWRSW